MQRLLSAYEPTWDLETGPARAVLLSRPVRDTVRHHGAQGAISRRLRIEHSEGDTTTTTISLEQDLMTLIDVLTVELGHR